MSAEAAQGYASTAGAAPAPPSALAAAAADRQVFPSDPGQARLPVAHVSVQSLHTGGSDVTMLHIQDAHSNLSGQKSLAAALDELMTRYPVELVLVEGGSGDVTLDRLKSAGTREQWTRAANRLLYEGLIAGEEYLNLTTDHPVRLEGIEEKSLYRQSLKVYDTIVRHRKNTLPYLRRISIALDRVKNRLYPDTLLAYESALSASADGGAGAQGDPDAADFGTRIEKLLALAVRMGVDPAAFASVRELLLLKTAEKRIRFERAQAEEEGLVAAAFPDRGSDAFKAYAEARRKARTSPVAQLALLNDLLARSGRSRESLFMLGAYLQYLEDFAKLDMNVLLLEMERLEDTVYLEALKDDEDARMLRACDRFLGLLRKAYRIQMSSDEFRMLKLNESDFPTRLILGFLNRQLAELGYGEDLTPYETPLEDARYAIELFYRLVDKRDRAFIANAKAAVAASGAKTAVLITGGYHTAHLEKLMRTEDWSYAVLTPAVEFQTDQEQYEKLLLAPLRVTRRKLARSEAPVSAASGPSKARDGLRAQALGARFAAAPDARVGAIVQNIFEPSDADQILRSLGSAASIRNGSTSRPSAARMAVQREKQEGRTPAGPGFRNGLTRWYAGFMKEFYRNGTLALGVSAFSMLLARDYPGVVLSFGIGFAGLGLVSTIHFARRMNVLSAAGKRFWVRVILQSILVVMVAHGSMVGRGELRRLVKGGLPSDPQTPAVATSVSPGLSAGTVSPGTFAKQVVTPDFAVPNIVPTAPKPAPIVQPAAPASNSEFQISDEVDLRGIGALMGQKLPVLEGELAKHAVRLQKFVQPILRYEAALDRTAPDRDGSLESRVLASLMLRDHLAFTENDYTAKDEKRLEGGKPAAARSFGYWQPLDTTAADVLGQMAVFAETGAVRPALRGQEPRLRALLDAFGPVILDLAEPALKGQLKKRDAAGWKQVGSALKKNGPLTPQKIKSLFSSNAETEESDAKVAAQFAVTEWFLIERGVRDAESHRSKYNTSYLADPRLNGLTTGSRSEVYARIARLRTSITLAVLADPSPERQVLGRSALKRVDQAAALASPVLSDITRLAREVHNADRAGSPVLPSDKKRTANLREIERLRSKLTPESVTGTALAVNTVIGDMDLTLGFDLEDTANRDIAVLTERFAELAAAAGALSGAADAAASAKPAAADTVKIFGFDKDQKELHDFLVKTALAMGGIKEGQSQAYRGGEEDRLTLHEDFRALLDGWWEGTLPEGLSDAPLWKILQLAPRYDPSKANLTERGIAPAVWYLIGRGMDEAHPDHNMQLLYIDPVALGKPELIGDPFGFYDFKESRVLGKGIWGEAHLDQRGARRSFDIVPGDSTSSSKFFSREKYQGRFFEPTGIDAAANATRATFIKDVVTGIAPVILKYRSTGRPVLMDTHVHWMSKSTPGAEYPLPVDMPAPPIASKKKGSGPQVAMNTKGTSGARMASRKRPDHVFRAVLLMGQTAADPDISTLADTVERLEKGLNSTVITIHVEGRKKLSLLLNLPELARLMNGTLSKTDLGSAAEPGGRAAGVPALVLPDTREARRLFRKISAEIKARRRTALKWALQNKIKGTTDLYWIEDHGVQDRAFVRDAVMSGLVLPSNQSLWMMTDLPAVEPVTQYPARLLVKLASRTYQKRLNAAAGDPGLAKKLGILEWISPRKDPLREILDKKRVRSNRLFGGYVWNFAPEDEFKGAIEWVDGLLLKRNRSEMFKPLTRNLQHYFRTGKWLDGYRTDYPNAAPALLSYFERLQPKLDRFRTVLIADLIDNERLPQSVRDEDRSEELEELIDKITSSFIERLTLAHLRREYRLTFGPNIPMPLWLKFFDHSELGARYPKTGIDVSVMEGGWVRVMPEDVPAVHRSDSEIHIPDLEQGVRGKSWLTQKLPWLTEHSVRHYYYRASYHFAAAEHLVQMRDRSLRDRNVWQKAFNELAPESRKNILEDRRSPHETVLREQLELSDRMEWGLIPYAASSMTAYIWSAITIYIVKAIPALLIGMIVLFDGMGWSGSGVSAPQPLRDPLRPAIVSDYGRDNTREAKLYRVSGTDQRYFAENFYPERSVGGVYTSRRPYAARTQAWNDDPFNPSQSEWKVGNAEAKGEPPVLVPGHEQPGAVLGVRKEIGTEDAEFYVAGSGGLASEPAVLPGMGGAYDARLASGIPELAGLDVAVAAAKEQMKARLIYTNGPLETELWNRYSDAPLALYFGETNTWVTRLMLRMMWGDRGSATGYKLPVQCSHAATILANQLTAAGYPASVVTGFYDQNKDGVLSSAEGHAWVSVTDRNGQHRIVEATSGLSTSLDASPLAFWERPLARLLVWSAEHWIAAGLLGWAALFAVYRIGRRFVRRSSVGPSGPSSSADAETTRKGKGAAADLQAMLKSLWDSTSADAAKIDGLVRSGVSGMERVHAESELALGSARTFQALEPRIRRSARRALAEGAGAVELIPVDAASWTVNAPAAYLEIGLQSVFENGRLTNKPVSKLLVSADLSVSLNFSPALPRGLYRLDLKTAGARMAQAQKTQKDLPGESLQVFLEKLQAAPELATAENLAIALDMLKDFEWEVRQSALKALPIFIQADKSAFTQTNLKLVIGMLDDSRGDVRQSALEALPTFIQADKTRAIRAILKLVTDALKDPDWLIRQSALEALPIFIQADKAHATPANLQLVTDALKDPEWPVRQSALKALPTFIQADKAHATPANLKLVIGMLKDHNADVRQSAQEPLRQILSVLWLSPLTPEGIEPITLLSNDTWTLLLKSLEYAVNTLTEEEQATLFKDLNTLFTGNLAAETRDMKEASAASLIPILTDKALTAWLPRRFPDMPQGARMASALAAELRLKEEVVLEGYDDPSQVGAVEAAASADGRHLALGGIRGDVRIHDARTGRLILLHQDPEKGEVRDLVWSADGNVLAAVVGIRVLVWRLDAQVLAAVRTPALIPSSSKYYGSDNFSVTLSKDGRSLAVAASRELSRQAQIDVYNLSPSAGPPLLYSLPAVKTLPAAMAFMPDGRSILQVSRHSGEILITEGPGREGGPSGFKSFWRHDALSMKEIEPFKRRAGIAMAAASPVAVSFDGAGMVRRFFFYPSGPLGWEPAGQSNNAVLTVGDLSDAWNANTVQPLEMGVNRSTPSGVKGRPSLEHLAVSPDGKFAALVHRELVPGPGSRVPKDSIRLVELGSGEKFTDVMLPQEILGMVRAMSFTEDGSELRVQTGRSVRIYDTSVLKAAPSAQKARDSFLNYGRLILERAEMLNGKPADTGRRVRQLAEDLDMLARNEAAGREFDTVLARRAQEELVRLMDVYNDIFAASNFGNAAYMLQAVGSLRTRKVSGARMAKPDRLSKEERKRAERIEQLIHNYREPDSSKTMNFVLVDQPGGMVIKFLSVGNAKDRKSWREGLERLKVHESGYMNRLPDTGEGEKYDDWMSLYQSLRSLYNERAALSYLKTRETPSGSLRVPRVLGAPGDDLWFDERKIDLLGAYIASAKPVSGIPDVAAQKQFTASLDPADREEIIRLTGLIRDPGRIRFVMEHIEGADLHQLLNRPRTAAESIGLSLELLVSLREMFDAGMSHGDIKPANVILKRPGRFRRWADRLLRLLLGRRADRPVLNLIDWGGSFYLDSDYFRYPDTADKNRLRSIAGTTAYLVLDPAHQDDWDLDRNAFLHRDIAAAAISILELFGIDPIKRVLDKVQGYGRYSPRSARDLLAQEIPGVSDKDRDRLRSLLTDVIGELIPQDPKALNDPIAHLDAAITLLRRVSTDRSFRRITIPKAGDNKASGAKTAADKSSAARMADPLLLGEALKGGQKAATLPAEVSRLYDQLVSLEAPAKVGRVELEIAESIRPDHIFIKKASQDDWNGSHIVRQPAYLKGVFKADPISLQGSSLPRGKALIRIYVNTTLDEGLIRSIDSLLVAPDGGPGEWSGFYKYLLPDQGSDQSRVRHTLVIYRIVDEAAIVRGEDGVRAVDASVADEIMKTLQPALAGNARPSLAGSDAGPEVAAAPEPSRDDIDEVIVSAYDAKGEIRAELSDEMKKFIESGFLKFKFSYFQLEALRQYLAALPGARMAADREWPLVDRLQKVSARLGRPQNDGMNNITHFSRHLGIQLALEAYVRNEDPSPDILVFGPGAVSDHSPFMEEVLLSTGGAGRYIVIDTNPIVLEHAVRPKFDPRHYTHLDVLSERMLGEEQGAVFTMMRRALPRLRGRELRISGVLQDAGVIHDFGREQVDLVVAPYALGYALKSAKRQGKAAEWLAGLVKSVRPGGRLMVSPSDLKVLSEKEFEKALSLIRRKSAGRSVDLVVHQEDDDLIILGVEDAASAARMSAQDTVLRTIDRMAGSGRAGIEAVRSKVSSLRDFETLMGLDLRVRNQTAVNRLSSWSGVKKSTLTPEEWDMLILAVITAQSSTKNGMTRRGWIAGALAAAAAAGLTVHQRTSSGAADQKVHALYFHHHSNLDYPRDRIQELLSGLKDRKAVFVLENFKIDEPAVFADKTGLVKQGPLLPRGVSWGNELTAHLASNADRMEALFEEVSLLSPDQRTEAARLRQTLDQAMKEQNRILTEWASGQSPAASLDDLRASYLAESRTHRERDELFAKNIERLAARYPDQDIVIFRGTKHARTGVLKSALPADRYQEQVLSSRFDWDPEELIQRLISEAREPSAADKETLHKGMLADQIYNQFYITLVQRSSAEPDRLLHAERFGKLLGRMTVTDLLRLAGRFPMVLQRNALPYRQGGTPSWFSLLSAIPNDASAGGINDAANSVAPDVRAEALDMLREGGPLMQYFKADTAPGARMAQLKMTRRAFLQRSSSASAGLLLSDLELGREPMRIGDYSARYLHELLPSAMKQGPLTTVQGVADLWNQAGPGAFQVQLTPDQIQRIAAREFASRVTRSHSKVTRLFDDPYADVGGTLSVTVEAEFVKRMERMRPEALLSEDFVTRQVEGIGAHLGKVLMKSNRFFAPSAPLPAPRAALSTASRPREQRLSETSSSEPMSDAKSVSSQAEKPGSDSTSKPGSSAGQAPDLSVPVHLSSFYRVWWLARMDGKDGADARVTDPMIRQSIADLQSLIQAEPGYVSTLASGASYPIWVPAHQLLGVVRRSEEGSVVRVVEMAGRTVDPADLSLQVVGQDLGPTVSPEFTGSKVRPAVLDIPASPLAQDQVARSVRKALDRILKNPQGFKSVRVLMSGAVDRDGESEALAQRVAGNLNRLSGREVMGVYRGGIVSAEQLKGNFERTVHIVAPDELQSGTANLSGRGALAVRDEGGRMNAGLVAALAFILQNTDMEDPADAQRFVDDANVILRAVFGSQVPKVRNLQAMRNVEDPDQVQWIIEFAIPAVLTRADLDKATLALTAVLTSA